MAIEERFGAVFTARDETAAVLRQIGARFNALSRDAGLTRLAASVSGIGRAFGNLALQVVSVAGPMAALGAGVAATGLAALAVRTASMGDDLGDLSDRTGIAIGDLQSLGDVARRAGVDQDTLATSLQKLNRGLADAATGGNADLAAVMRQLGIAMRDSNGHIRSAADILPQLANAFERTENQALRVRLATELFGRSGEQLIPMLAQGGAALREGQERWQRYGFSMASVAERMSEADGQFKDMQVAVGGLVDAIGAQLAPVLGPIAAQIADWTAANRDAIATRFGEYVQEIATATAGFFADRGPLDRLQEFGTMLSGAVEAMGGFQNILIGFGALAVSPFIAAILSIGASLAPLVVAIGSFGLALAATPIGWFIGAVAALGYAAYEMHQNWDAIAGWFAGLWTRIHDAWAPKVGEMVRLVTGLGAFLVSPLVAAWEPVAGFFSGLWTGIVSTFTGAWEMIRPIVEAVSAIASRITGAGTAPDASRNPGANADGQAQRRQNWRNRGSLGPGAGPLTPGVDSPLISPLSSGPVPGAPAGQVGVTVTFENAPPGTRVAAESTGPLIDRPRTDVGYSLGGTR